MSWYATQQRPRLSHVTLILGLRSSNGVVLAADSQRTEGPIRGTIPKIFAAPSGVVWGTAGNIAIQQELYALLHESELPSNPTREVGRDAVVEALREATRRATDGVTGPSEASLTADGLF